MIGVKRNIAANKTHFCVYRSSAGLDALGIDGDAYETGFGDSDGSVICDIKE